MFVNVQTSRWRSRPSTHCIYCLQSRTPSNRKASFGLCCWTGLIFLHACIALRSFTISFFCVRSFRQIYWTVYHINNSSLSSSTPLCNLDNNLEKNYVWKRLNWSGISQGYQTTRVVCLLALCLCTTDDALDWMHGVCRLHLTKSCGGWHS